MSQQNPKSPSIPCVGLEVIIWEGLFYHIKCKIVYLSVLWFFFFLSISPILFFQGVFFYLYEATLHFTWALVEVVGQHQQV